MSFDDIEQRLRKAQVSADFYAREGVLDIVRFRPADIVKETATPHQVLVNSDLHAPGDREGLPGNRDTVGYDVVCTAGGNKDRYIRIMHSAVHNTTLDRNFNIFADAATGH